MIAIDGVAPQAKMCQQRTRRFMSAYSERKRRQIELEVHPCPVNPPKLHNLSVQLAQWACNDSYARLIHTHMLTSSSACDTAQAQAWSMICTEYKQVLHAHVALHAGQKRNDSTSQECCQHPCSNSF